MHTCTTLASALKDRGTIIGPRTKLRLITADRGKAHRPTFHQTNELLFWLSLTSRSSPFQRPRRRRYLTVAIKWRRYLSAANQWTEWEEEEEGQMCAGMAGLSSPNLIPHPLRHTSNLIGPSRTGREFIQNKPPDSDDE